MIAAIAEQFTTDPSDRERSPAMIWKPGLSLNEFQTNLAVIVWTGWIKMGEVSKTEQSKWV